MIYDGDGDGDGDDDDTKVANVKYSINITGVSTRLDHR